MSRDTLFYIVMGMLAAGLVLLFINHDSGSTLGLANEQFGRLVLLTSLATVFAAGLFRRGRFGQTMRYALIWLVLLMVLATGYLYRHDLQFIGARISAGLMPGTAVTRVTAEGESEVVISRSEGGHFVASATVDGEEVDFLVDTGASIIALSWDDAMRIGIDPETLEFDRRVMTANGPAQAASVRLDTVSVGNITREDVGAIVSQEGALPRSLLGMNFLGDLSSFEMRRDVLILRD
jgi:aspartyl protease family protein